jgi:hypothetical protein
VGLHGRLSHLPARDLAINREWLEGSYRIVVSGTALDYSVMGPALRLTRTYCITMGENTIRIHDEITNFGTKPEPLFLLYHFNFGYPLGFRDGKTGDLTARVGRGEGSVLRGRG